MSFRARIGQFSGRLSGYTPARCSGRQPDSDQDLQPTGVMPQELDRLGPDDIGCLHHDHVTEDLVSDDDLWKHQDVGVASARVAEPMDLKW
jgi:hypothetical protein